MDDKKEKVGIDVENILVHTNEPKPEYHICTLSPNCEAYCRGDCDNCGLFQEYLHTYHNKEEQ